MNGLRDLVAFDGLSALFVALIAVVGAAAALFAPRYLSQPRYAAESRARYHALMALFVAGMVVAVMAADWILFLVAWEVMTLASYALVVYEVRDAEALRAGFRYFVMTHCGTACLLFAAIVLWAAGGTFAWSAMPRTFAAWAAQSPATLHAVLALCVLGFATKAGLYPFGDWLPDAHPAAPAPVSALLSGVMIKLGLYGLLRVFVWALAAADPRAAVVWGYGLVALGTVSALLGGAAAAAARDVKVLLAYSSVAQSGMIALGIGAALVLVPAHPALATLALLGALFHLASDACVKALLFLNAGALQYATGSRRLDDLGGLLRAMPVTAAAALVGCAAIAGVPPLTAFTSKWLLLQSTVLSRDPAVCVAGLALLVASALSVLYAVKLWTGAFGARPMRRERLEAPRSMQAAQAGLAGATLVLAAAPGLWLQMLAGVARGAPAWARLPAADAWSAWSLAPGTGAYAPLALLGAGAIAWLAVRVALGAPSAAPARVVPVWQGGLAAGEGAHGAPQGFLWPIRGALARAYPRLAWPRMHEPRWWRGAADLDVWLYRPAIASGRQAGGVLRRLHTGVPHVYLAWQLAGAVLLALLVLLRR